MDYSARHISGEKYQINLIPEKPEEHQMLKDLSREDLEMQFHHAVSKKLGANSVLLEVENDKLLPYSIIGIVSKATGLGGY
ncbi:MAG: hypothetical protein JWQ30_1974 [Sediminibacterium sp.]|nr:hypothetical protein [Sediminibacterium sp.]